MKHARLSLDPGDTTGWALLADDGSVMATSVWGTHEIRESLDMVVRQAYSAGYAIDVVVEDMPSTGANGPLGKKLEWVRKQIDFVISETYELPVHHILPGVWKPSRIARTTELPKAWRDEPLMIHQKDAIRMGMYAIAIRPRFARQRDLGE